MAYNYENDMGNDQTFVWTVGLVCLSTITSVVTIAAGSNIGNHLSETKYKDCLEFTSRSEKACALILDVDIKEWKKANAIRR